MLLMSENYFKKKFDYICDLDVLAFKDDKRY